MSQLNTCDKRLATIAHEVVKYFDHRITDGHRDEDEQNEAYRLGRSMKPWPESKHNICPSIALDVAPWYVDPPHIRWNTPKDFTLLAGYYLAIGDTLGIKLRWGGDWDGDKTTYDQNFHDLGHLEIVEMPGREEIEQLIAAHAENQRNVGLV